LEKLQANLRKCVELLDSVSSGDTKRKLRIKKEEISEAIDRLSLCVDILDYNVSIKVSNDFREVKFV
jgi:hypothetical protein